jgi:hypothetical protein
MSPEKTTSERWTDYRPSKSTWFWSIIGASVVTMVVGFSFGGWTTGGSAAAMASKAAQDARAELASSVCVDNFAAAENASQQLVVLKDKSSWEQDDFIKDGGWAKLLGSDKIIEGAADLCADKLMAMEQLPQDTAEIRPVGG